jgi:hypothetical protein
MQGHKTIPMVQTEAVIEMEIAEEIEEEKKKNIDLQFWLATFTWREN